MSITIRKDAWRIKDDDGIYRSADLFSTMLPSEAQQLITETRAEFTNMKNEADAVLEGLAGTKQEILDLESQTKSDITSLGNTKKEEITQESTTQKEAITLLGNTTKQDIISEGTAQVQTVNAKGQEVLASIPNDYTGLVKTVESMSYGGFVYNEAAGTTASFDDGADGMLIKSLVANIDPVQDLHGYDSPWAGGSGKNLLVQKRENQTISGVTFTWDNQGVIHCSGTQDATFIYDINGGDPFILNAGTYYLSGKNVATTAGSTAIMLRTARNTSSSAIAVNDTAGEFVSFTLNETTSLYPIIYISSKATPVDSSTFSPMIRLASETDATYEPYENYCQPTGHTSVTISHSGTDTSNPETLSVSWQSAAGIVYGGTIDVVSGKLKIKYKKYTFDGVGAVSDGLSFTKGSSSSVRMYYSLSSNNSPLITTQATNVYVNNLKCSHFPFGTTTIPNSAFVVQGQLRVALPLDDSRNTAALFNAWVKEQYDNGTPLEMVAELSQPIEVQLTPQEIECLAGVNNIWADTGDVTVTYPVDTKTYIDKKIQEAIDGLSGS